MDSNSQHLFVCYEIDPLSNDFALLEADDAPHEVRAYHASIARGDEIWNGWAFSNMGKVIYLGSGRGMLEMPLAASKDISNLQEDYRNFTGSDLSVGVGMSMSDAQMAQRVAHKRSEHFPVLWEDSMREELEEPDETEGEDEAPQGESKLQEVDDLDKGWPKDEKENQENMAVHHVLNDTLGEDAGGKVLPDEPPSMAKVKTHQSTVRTRLNTAARNNDYRANGWEGAYDPARDERLDVIMGGYRPDTNPLNWQGRISQEFLFENAPQTPSLGSASRPVEHVWVTNNGDRPYVASTLTKPDESTSHYGHHLENGKFVADSSWSHPKYATDHTPVTQALQAWLDNHPQRSDIISWANNAGSGWDKNWSQWKPYPFGKSEASPEVGKDEPPATAEGHFKGLADKQAEKDEAQAKADQAQDKEWDKTRTEIVEFLQQIKQAAPTIDQLQQTQPDLHQVVMGLVQALAQLGAKVSGKPLEQPQAKPPAQTTPQQAQDQTMAAQAPVQKAWPKDEKENQENEAAHHVANDALYDKGAQEVTKLPPSPVSVESFESNPAVNEYNGDQRRFYNLTGAFEPYGFFENKHSPERETDYWETLANAPPVSVGRSSLGGSTKSTALDLLAKLKARQTKKAWPKEDPNNTEEVMMDSLQDHGFQVNHDAGEKDLVDPRKPFDPEELNTPGWRQLPREQYEQEQQIFLNNPERKRRLDPALHNAAMSGMAGTYPEKPGYLNAAGVGVPGFMGAPQWPLSDNRPDDAFEQNWENPDKVPNLIEGPGYSAGFKSTAMNLLTKLKARKP